MGPARTLILISNPTLDYKTPHKPPLSPGWTHSFEGISLLWPPLPGKAIKLLFSTPPKTLSLDLIWCWNTEARFGFTSANFGSVSNTNAFIISIYSQGLLRAHQRFPVLMHSTSIWCLQPAVIVAATGKKNTEKGQPPTGGT